MNKVKKWVMAAAIAIVFNLFVNYGIATFYPGPEYSDFCQEQPRLRPTIERQDCEAVQISEELQKALQSGVEVRGDVVWVRTLAIYNQWKLGRSEK